MIEPQATRLEIIEQLKQDIEEFYASVRRRYLALRRKHVRELKEFRRLTNGIRGTGNNIKRCYNCKCNFYTLSLHVYVTCVVSDRVHKNFISIFLFHLQLRYQQLLVFSVTQRKNKTKTI